MSSIRHLYIHIKQYRESHKPLYVLSVMIFFWTIFDSILSYAIPLILTEHGLSSTMMGLVIGSSSIAGAGFDFLMCRFVKRVDFRRVFMGMFAISALYPLILWQATIIPMYLLGMVIWGIYYDLLNFGIFDFVSRHTEKNEHSASFGVVQVFRSLGGIIAPLIASLLIIDLVDWKTFAGSFLFLSIGFLFLIFLLILTRKKKMIVTCVEENCCEKPKNFLNEIHLWKSIGKYIFPALVLTFFLYTVEAFFWTIGPIYSETLGLGEFSGLLLTMYSLPSIFVGWFVGRLTEKYGKLKVAYVSFLVASILLSGFALVSMYMPVLTIGLTFLVAVMVSISFPSVNGAYADYISDIPKVEKEVESLEDFFTNMGYVAGPILSGFLADVLGAEKAFSLIGVVGVLLSVILLRAAAKRAKLNEKQA